MTSKITRKQFLASATGLAVAIPAIWRSDRAFAQGAVTLKLGHPDTPLHPTQAVATRFSEMVAAKTGGAIRIQVFSGGQLGSEVRCNSIRHVETFARRVKRETNRRFAIEPQFVVPAKAGVVKI